jgi:hypothetical protein
MGGRRTGAAALAAALVIGLVAVAPALAASPRDVASTKTFIRSSVRYDLVSLRLRHAVAARADAYVQSVARGCDKGLANAPRQRDGAQQEALLELELESSLALEVRSFAAIRPITDQVARVQGGLRFSDSVLAWTVHTDAAATSALLAMHVPDLCADVRALVASHYKRITPAGAKFVEDGGHIVPAASVSPTALAKRMRPLAPGVVDRGVKRLKGLQGQLRHKVSLLPHDHALLRVVFGGPPPAGL